MICSTPISVHLAVSGGICRDAACLREKVLREARAAKKRMLRRQRYRARKCLAEARHGLSEIPLLAIVPVNAGHIEPLSVHRHDAFLGHLQGIFDQLDETAGDDNVVPVPAPAPLSPVAERALESACATCRGFCCRSAGTQAFIDGPAVARFLRANPEMNHDDAVQAYAAHLPTQTWDNSCVFHGAAGCELPREMRSDTCNQYFCDELKKTRKQLAKDSSVPVFVVAMRDDVVHRTNIVVKGKIKRA